MCFFNLSRKLNNLPLIREISYTAFILQAISMTIHRINPSKRWSDITIYNGVANFVEIAECEMPSSIETQTLSILEQAQKTLESINSDKTKILTATIYITDFANLDGLNDVWDNWFEPDTAPSRACVKVELADPQWLVEIAFTAVAGKRFQ